MKIIILALLLMTLTAPAGATSPCPSKFTERLTSPSLCRVSMLKNNQQMLTQRFEGLRVEDLEPDSSTYRFHGNSPRGSHLLGIYNKFGSLTFKDWFRAAEKFFGSHGLNKEVRRLKAGARGKHGRFHPLSAAETLLVNEHLLAHPDDYREFRALVLVRGTQVKILQAISLRADGVAPNFARAGFEIELQGARQAGWKIQADLHNHPFVIEREFGNSGLLIPSLVDLKVFSEVNSHYGVHQFWITNGYQSLRIAL